jgi:phenylpropionate dioxygenase-like ring-hydroxylating dioxygenase large terminal subunit
MAMTAAENEMLTRIGKGTPMGEYFRRFWHPAVASSEVPAPDSPPVRVRLLGEDLIAFRDSSGKVGLLHRYSRHRRTDLFFGRNEEGGLRCAYHGWKFDVNGNCMELPTEPADTRLKQEARAIAYPTREFAGIVWAYMGPPEIQAEFPYLEFNYLPKENIYFRKSLLECNFMQALEGQFDSSHIGFLHSFVAQKKGAAGISGVSLGKSDAADSVRTTVPKMETQDTDFGFMLAAKRAGAQGKSYLRVTQWCLPNHTFIANPPGETLLWDAWVPVDDHNTWVYRISYNPWRPITDKEIYEFDNAGLMPFSVQNMPGTYLPIRNKRNDYLIDRFVQREFTYSGIQGNNAQDAAIIENQGPTPIYDRTQETLGATDLGIARARRRLLAEARSVQEGKQPTLARNGNLIAVRPIAVFVPDDGTPFHEQPEAKKYMYLEQYPQAKETVPAK